jgi:hypothetical protein
MNRSSLHWRGFPRKRRKRRLTPSERQKLVYVIGIGADFSGNSWVDNCRWVAGTCPVDAGGVLYGKECGMARDFIDEIVAERTARNPNFPKMVEEELARLDREYPPPADAGPRISPSMEEHRRILTAAPRNSGQGNSARKVVTVIKELADRRKHKTPA